MPIHDWTRVSAGDFHDFHQVWTGQVRILLNEGVLPPGYYAQVEQRASGVIPDVLTLQYGDDQDLPAQAEELAGAIAVAQAPPQVEMVLDLERRVYTERKNIVVIRHVSDNRVVAMIEIVSSGNKSSEREFRRFLEKSLEAIEQGVHLLIVDLYPPMAFDPQGMHAAVWTTLGEVPPPIPAKPLAAVSYLAAEVPRAYFSSLAVGDPLPEMPLFLTISHYVSAPLEAAYQIAFRSSPPHVKRALSEV
jgi:hypothetical protein